MRRPAPSQHRARTRRAILALAALAAVGGAAACGGDTRAGGPPQAVVDTLNGVVHVTNPEQTPQWSAVPVAAIGTTDMQAGDRPDEFGMISSIVADAAGNVYVAESQSREIRVFSRDGEHLRTIGRPGAGPGEFGNLYSLTWLGDTLAALDPGNARIQLMTAAGAPLDVMRWLPLTGPLDLIRFHRTGPHEFSLIGLREPGWQGWSFVRHTAAGPADTISVPRAADAPLGGVLCRGPDFIRSFTTPFGARTIVVPVAGRLAAVTDAVDYRIALVDARGDTLRVIRRSIPPVAISDAEWDEATEPYRTFRRESSGATCEGALTRPAHKPAVRGVFLDHDGNLIVEIQTPAGSALDFHDVDGRLLGSLPIPPRDRRIAPYLRDGYLYLVEQDELDVQRVGVYRIERSR